MNTSYIFTRNSYAKPAIYIPHDKPSVAISFCPFKFKLNTNVAAKYDLLNNENEEQADQQPKPDNIFK